MKKNLINILIIFIFIFSLIFIDYILLVIGFPNYYNYQKSNVENNALVLENKQLKEELNSTLSLNGLDKYQEYDFLKSNVLLRDVYNFHESITIRYGQDKNLKKGMAVVSDKGLIGTISKVNKKTSIVNLLTSKKSNISIKIDESYGALNDYNQNKDYLIASNFNNYEVIMKDDEVFTSGLGIIPPGLYIGKVVNTKEKNIEQQINIKSEIDFNNLKYIGIIRGLKDANN